MANRAEAPKLNWPRWQQALLIALLVLFIGNRLTTIVDTAAFRAGLIGEAPFAAGRPLSDPNAPAGFGRMIEVDPAGPYAKAGIRNGDFVRTDPSYHYLIRPVVGESVNFTLDRGGVRSENHIIIAALPEGHEQAQIDKLRVVNLLATIISMLVGCFILWRGWGNLTAMLLGAALTAIGRGGALQPAWAADVALAAPMWWLLTLFSASVAMLIPFAFRMFEQHGGALPRWHWRLFNIWFVWCLVSLTASSWDRLWLSNYMTWAGGFAYMPLLISINISVAILYLAAAWRRGSAAERNRIALITFALSAYLFAALLNSWDAMQTGAIFGTNTSFGLFTFNTVMQGLIAPGLLAYAVLRHKLFDLGFAVNRTLVFGAIGGLLLVSFALIEWAIKQAIPKVWYGGSVYISALIAVGLYLTFNRLHHKVEHAIERVFFHKWQVNEAALKRFVAAAAHMEKPEALGQSFVTELARFSGGGAVALYLRTPAGLYSDGGGNGPVDTDDLALAAMRAEQGPVVPAEVGSPLDAALALPMLHQAALAGFVLLGPKPTGEDYRPDEIEMLGWATQQVGLDLQAIRVRELELTNIKMAVQIQTLTDVLASPVLAPAGGETK